MRAVIQRVHYAAVRVEKIVTGEIEKGLLVYLGVGKDDSLKDLDYIVDKVVNLRIFEDEGGKMNLSIRDSGGDILVVSQFTLYGDCRKGRRPSFTNAADLSKAEDYYNKFVNKVKAKGVAVGTGIFRATMAVESVNDGPVTILLDSKKAF